MSPKHPLPRPGAVAAGAAVLLALFLVPVSGTAAPGEDPTPTLPPEAHWVPLVEAFSDGAVREGLFSDVEKRHIRDWLRDPEATESRETDLAPRRRSTEECDVLIVTSAGIQHPDPKEALHGTAVALTGTVTAIEPGLHHGRLASLVTVEVDRWLKAEAGTARPATARFIYPEGRATIDGTRYCHQGTRAERLAVGREVFLGADTVLAEDPLVLYPLTRNVYFETPDRQVSAEGPMAREAPEGWSAFKNRVMLLTEAEGGSR